MRQRVEDLGRLAVLLRNLLDSDQLEDLPVRRKEYAEWFLAQDKDKQYDIIHAWAYGLDEIKDKLFEMLCIAEGTDNLNEQFKD